MDTKQFAELMLVARGERRACEKFFWMHRGRHGFSLTPLYDVLSGRPFIGHGSRKLLLRT